MPARFTFLLLLLAALLPAQTAAPGQLDANPALFTVMAALDATGNIKEVNAVSNHPFRAQVREAIRKKNPASLAPLKAFFDSHKTDSEQRDLSQYVAFALCLNPPPTFDFRLAKSEVPPDVLKLDGLQPLLSKFYREAGVEELWKQAQPAIDQVLARYQPQVLPAVEEANAYLRSPTSGIRNRRFQIWVELLGPPNYVQRWINADDYVIVLTPSEKPRLDEVRRAYLHYLIDAWMLTNGTRLEAKRPIQDLAGASPILDELYKTDFSLLAGMSLVRAVEARLSPPAQRQQMVDRAMSEGFILTAYFYESLPAYEKDERSMRLYMGDLIDGIDLKKEDRRIANVQFATQREVKVVKRQPPPPPEPSAQEKQIAAADLLYEQRNLEKAKEAFRAILTTEGPKPWHARAYYGLARIAALEKDPQLALDLFEKALQMDPEPAVEAWLHVYLARLARAAQEPDKAVEQYKAALAVNGASEMALSAARKELEAVTSRKEE